MWSRFTGKSDGAKDRDDEKRKRSDSSATRRSKTSESVVSSSSTRRPSGRDSRSRVSESPASSHATFATGRDERDDMRSNADLYEDPRDDERRRRRRDDDERSTYSRRDRSRSRDRSDKDRKSDKDGRVKKKKSRSEAGGSRAQEIVEAPRRDTRSVVGQMEGGGFSQYPDHNGPPVMSGGLPAGTLSSHVQDQFPGQNPQQYATPFVPHAPVHTDSFGEAAEYYGDQGQSVQHQPGVRIERPSVIVSQDQLHLTTASATANPVADTGSGTAAEFYGTANTEPQQPSKPPRPSSMPGAFTDDEPLPAKPPRPSKPNKPGKLSSAATLAGAAGLGYAIHESSHTHTQNTQHTQHTTSYTNGAPGGTASMYYQGENPSTAATNGSYNGTSSYLPPYNEATEGIPPPKPPRPGKQPSGSSHAGLYTAGAAGLAAYGLAHHNSHNHSHTHSMPGGFPGGQYGSYGSSPGALMPGGMAHKHEHKGPVSKFADWWKNLDDVRRMEEYTEYIGVCKDCFDPRSSPMDAPRKHHYNRRKRSGELRPTGIKEKHSRYGLHEKASRSSFSDEERRGKRKGTSNSTAGWVAAGLGGIGLAKAGQAFFNQQRNDFDDTYSVKSGRDARSRVSRRSRSRSRSRDRHHYSSGRSEVRRRSRSEDRLSRMSVGITGDRKDRKDYKIVRHHSRSRSRSHSRDHKSGILGAALGAGIAATAVNAARKKHRSRSRSRSRSHSPQNVFVHHRRDGSDRERRYSKNARLKHKSSRSSVGSASIVDVSRPQQNQGGFLGGFFAVPPPKEKRRQQHSHSKKKKGFFNFGNASSSSSDSDIAFGQGFVQRKKRPTRRTSEEKLHATLAGLGATAAAIAAAKAARNGSRHHSEVVAVRENRHQTHGRRRRQSGSSRYGDVDADWEDLPDGDTTDSGSVSSGLAFGDFDLRKTKSRESLNSNGSGTSKWGWRWGSKKQTKKPSSESLYNAGANTSLIGPAAVGAVAGAAIGTGLHRHESSASSNVSLQQVFPVQASADPTSFDAWRTSSAPTPQPLVTSQSGPMSIQQPQPMHQVPGSIYSTQAPPQPGYTAPSGPPVFSQPGPSQYSSFHHPAPLRRANSSPVQSSWKRDATIAAVGAGLAGAAVASVKRDRTSSPASNVRFDFTEEQARKERKRHADEERDEEDDRRRRLDETERREQERRKAELQRQQEAREEAEERRRRLDETDRREQERRKIELQRQQEEARRYLEAERLAKQEAEHREAERRREEEAKGRREQEERIARRAREKAEEQERREHELRLAAERTRQLELEEEQKRRERIEQERRAAEQRKRVLGFEEEQKRRERRETDRRAAEQRETEKREAEIQQDLERRRREAEEYANRYKNERDRRPPLEQQRTGSSIASDVRRKERELEDRERDIVQPDTWKTPVAAATVAVAAAAITSAAISSSKRDDRRSKTSSAKIVEPAAVKEIAPSAAISSKHDDRRRKTSSVKTVEPAAVKEIAPSMIAQDYADDDIFDPNIFKKPIRAPSSAKEVYQEWEDRYISKDEPVSQADFFAPKELLENTSAPVVKVDPNEGAPPEFHIYQAHDDHEYSAPRYPPYPPSYSFTATKDGRGPKNPPYPIPELNLIQPTPPGSRANSVRGVSVPPSPNIEPVEPPNKEEPKPEEGPRRGSRVSWGPDQFHNYEVPTPDSYREQFISTRDLGDHAKQSQDEIIVEADSPHSGSKTTKYRPEEPKLPEPVVPSSTQYVPDQDNDDWAGTMPKKASKKDKKKAKAAAAAAAVTAPAVLARDDTDNVSIMTDPFADKYAASTVSAAPSTSSAWSTPYSESPSDVTVIPARTSDKYPASTVSAVPSTSSAWSTPYSKSASDVTVLPARPSDKYPASTVSAAPSTNSAWSTPYSESASDISVTPARPKTYVNDEIATEPEPMHMPGGFEGTPTPTPVTEATEDDWTASAKKDKKGKKSSRTDKDTFTVPESTREVVPEPEGKLSKKDKKKKKSKSVDDDPYAQDVPARVASPLFSEPEPVLVEERRHEREIPDDLADTAKLSKKDKKKKSNGAEEDFFDQPPPSSADVQRLPEPEPAREPLPEPEPEKPSEDDWVAPAKLSKKDKKKKAKAAKKGIADSPDDTGSSQPSSPIIERDLRDIEPILTGDVARDTTRGNPSSSSATTAAMAGGFAALVGAAMKQDQDRIASDFEHARESMEYARTLPSTAFHDVDELNDVKTPKKKNRVSSGRWSPSIGSPLRAEVQYDDYVGQMAGSSSSATAREPPQAPPVDLGLSHVFPSSIRDGHDSGYYAPDDTVQQPPADRDSDEFFSAGSEEQKSTIVKSPPSDRHDDREKPSVVSPDRKYDDEFDREERHRRRHETHSSSQSRDRGYELDNGDSPTKRRHHRRRGTDERSVEDWDSRSAISDTRSEATGERRRKHRHRDSERNGSPEEYRRSAAKSEPGDIESERKSSRRRSKRDDDDNMSVVSSPARYDEEKASKKDKEKRSSGLFGLFSRSKENLAETSSKSSKTREDEDDGERRRRRRKHREGSAYGSDDDDVRSTISSSSRREKRRSRTDGWDEKV
ncbi:hypothetical protein BU23DRAFT_108508 [Bimuria novae-zelandiae CBS 107.79]|uniref:Involucrin repeat protein n=1 Tax=Bimuria novae-zelandiae CBS 107.79 TaxID=1447943 RepID=A0A6A5VQE2_9PLEO|nr:hypothetical protein BU23DRAFT_108508 [Bimuria novae-zelandiae CBS 107.79]